jgi:hypothetical protein
VQSILRHFNILVLNQKSSQDGNTAISFSFLANLIFPYTRLKDNLQFVNSVKAIRGSPA